MSRGKPPTAARHLRGSPDDAAWKKFDNAIGLACEITPDPGITPGKDTKKFARKEKEEDWRFPKKMGEPRPEGTRKVWIRRNGLGQFVRKSHKLGDNRKRLKTLPRWK